MYYIFSTRNFKYEIEKQIMDTGKIIWYDNFLFMSKEKEFIIGNRTIKNSGTIDGWLYNFYLNKSVPLYGDVKIMYSEVADILVGELYQPCDDTGMTYADKIYKAKNLKEEVSSLYNRFLLVAIDNRMMDIKDDTEMVKLETRLEQIKKDISNGKCVWE